MFQTISSTHCENAIRQIGHDHRNRCSCQRNLCFPTPRTLGLSLLCSRHSASQLDEQDDVDQQTCSHPEDSVDQVEDGIAELKQNIKG